MGAWMLPAIIVVPLLSAAVVGYFRNTWSKTMVSWVACSSVAASFAMVLALGYQYWIVDHGETPITATLTSWGEILPVFGLLADGLSLWWMVVVAGAGLLIHIYSTAYMRDDESFGRFMAKLNYFIFAMSLLVLSDNFAGMLIGWANVGLASYMLIGFYIKKPEATAASMKAFVMNTIGEAGMIAGIAFIYLNFGSFKFDYVFDAIAKGHGAEYMNLIGILLLMGAVAKSAQMPLHTWLPNAMEGPTPVSALIHAATMVTAGVYLVSRAYPIYEAAPAAALTVAWVGGLGALFGAVVAAGQNDIKRVLAFSTLSQIGYMFLANGLGAYIAADFHFFTHAFFKACLFLTAGIVVHHYHTQDIRKMGGLWYQDKLTTLVFGAGTAALIGVPFITSGFFSKDEILLAAYHENMALFVVGVVAAGMTAFYNIRLFSLVFLGDAYTPVTKAVGKKKARVELHGHGHGHDDHHHATPGAMKWTVVILAALSIASGWIFFGHYQLHLLETSFPTLSLHPEAIDPVVASVATGMALIGGLVSWYLYGPKGVLRAKELDLNAKPGVLANMFYFDQIYDFLFVQPTKAIAEFIADVADAKGIDGFVNGLGSFTRGLGATLRGWQSGYIRSYALSIFAGVLLVVAYYAFYV
ncbi:MAG: NADH-quinone oxidoreductase subunit L [Bacillota bacterium]